MATRFQITMKDAGVKQYLNKIKNNTRAKRNVLKEIGRVGENIVQDEAEKIRAFGTLVNSINHVSDDKEASVFSLLKYADIALETGRKPSRKMPSVDAIHKWAAKKGIIPRHGSEGRSRAFLIARKIQREGTKKWRNKYPKQVTRARDKIRAQLPAIIKSMIDEFYT